MKSLFSLVKTNWVNTSGINKLFKSKKSKMFIYGALIIILIAYLLFVSTLYATLAADYLKKYNLLSFMLTMFFVLGTFGTFIFTIYNAKASLFNANDNDMLLSLPIKPGTILASRLITLTVSNLIASLFIMGPAMVVYAMHTNVTASYYLFAILIFILLPVIPTILACLVGYFVAYIASKTNAKNWVEIFVSFIFILAIMFLSGYGNQILTYIVKDMNTIEKILKWGFYPIYLVNEIFLTNSYLSLLIFISINAILSYIFILILSRSYRNIIARLQENKARSNFVMKDLKTASINKSLFMKDFKRYLSSPIYVLNTSFGVILILIMSVATIFYDKTKILAMFDLNKLNITPFMIIMLIVTFVVFMSNTAACSISIEGKNLWIMKSLPIETKKILNSKLILNFCLVLPVVLIATIIFKFTFALTLFQVLMVLLMAVISSFVAYQFGLLINLKFPKMDAISDMVVVKQSLSVMISVLVPMVLIFATTGIYSEIQKSISFNNFIFIIMAIFIILGVVERTLLNTWGVKRFKQIN